MRIQRKKAKPKSKKLFIIIPFLILLFSAGLFGIYFLNQSHSRQTTAPSDEKYYFADSKYSGIRSKFVTRDNKREKVSIEYPITENEKINRLISESIDKIDRDFQNTVLLATVFDKPMTETISYQVMHNTSEALSIIVNIKQDMNGAHPASMTQFWTFDKKSGEVVGLADFTEQSDEAAEAIISAAKNSISQTIKQRQQPEIDLNEIINKEALSNFIITNNGNSLAWPLGQASLLPSSYGELTITVPISSVSKYLQNPTARKLANIPKPPEPKPEPAPAPAAPTPAPTTGNKVIALTFDDGPGPYTAHLLDILDQYGAKATFFLIGSKVSGQASVVRSIQARGHQLGNHSWSHPELPKLSVDQIAGEIDRTNEAIRQATGVKPSILRPPYGAVNGVVLEQLRLRNMSSILWSVDTRDWADRNSQIVCSRAVAGARPGAVILMHDIHQTSVNAVPCILSSLKQQGYSFVTIQRLN
ncbi:polysaccharide deacetylase family protein [Candidatus Nanosynbacter sp. HMT-352]|uniref:polysaccharide deacetylase family protein n=1 Tax=Candidatus Nanosynbacter sp. HMT-352 TaxID=2899133 RepID=UPI001FB859CA|nr:polysaccharide deacetylase family protein [Candidatus Nanosynbacter sp. HMT-352]UOG67212.1 polysaccharide deacetylase family protein [Candidatus Nanosynbacter sp. HMT-352]